MRRAELGLMGVQEAIALHILVRCIWAGLLLGLLRPNQNNGQRSNMEEKGSNVIKSKRS